MEEPKYASVAWAYAQVVSCINKYKTSNSKELEYFMIKITIDRVV